MIYVDKLVDHGWRLGPSCHLLADSLEELHGFANKIGMKREWFQDKQSCPHYDLTAKRRVKAVKLGAKEISRKQLYELIKKNVYVAKKLQTDRVDDAENDNQG